MHNSFRHVICIHALLFLFLVSCKDKKEAVEDSKVQWKTWSEGIESARNNGKLSYIDMYTDWCGWCKRMDANTFTDPDVIKVMNKNLNAIKFNAERKDDIIFQDKEYKFVPSGKRGYHQLAAELLRGRLSYPSFIYLDENLKILKVSPGYKTPDQLLAEFESMGIQ